MALPSVEDSALVEMVAAAGYRARVLARRGQARDVGDDDGRPVDLDLMVTTGSRSRMLPIPGAEEAGVLNSITLMDLPHLPESLLVLGGRAVALELGQAMARLVAVLFDRTFRRDIGKHLTFQWLEGVQWECEKQHKKEAMHRVELRAVPC